MKLFHFVQLLTKFNNFFASLFSLLKLYFLIYITYRLYFDFYYIFFKYVTILKRKILT